MTTAPSTGKASAANSPERNAREQPAPEIHIRDVRDLDMPGIQEIYAHHVLTGLGSFELTPPSVDEMVRRRDALVEGGYPYVVAVTREDGTETDTLVGYAYAGAYRPRPAYRHTVENSVYVGSGHHRRGIGRALLGALITRCTDLGFRQMVAVIGDSANMGSRTLHERLGFEEVGCIRAVGYKFDRWVDSLIMQRALGPGTDTAPDRR